MAEMIARVKARSVAGKDMQTIVKARGFEFIVDEPKDMGGADEGANPVEYLLGAFAGCLNVVAHIVAKEMGFELKSLEINIKGNLNPAKLMGQPSEDRIGFKQITVELKPEADVDRATLDKWVETMENRCPISDNIQNATPVAFEIK